VKLDFEVWGGYVPLCAGSLCIPPHLELHIHMSGSPLVHTPSKPKHRQKHAAHPTSPLTSRIMSAIPTVPGQPARSLRMLEDDDTDARMGEAGPHEELEVQQPSSTGAQLPQGGAAQGPPAPSTSSVPVGLGAQGNPPHAPAAATLPGTAASPGGMVVAPAADGAPPTRASCKAPNPPTSLPDVPTTLRHPSHADFNQDVMAAALVGMWRSRHSGADKHAGGSQGGTRCTVGHV
jgi:hypothetical protein